MYEISLLIKKIDLAAVQGNYEEIEALINSMELTDQLGIHSELDRSTIKVIAENKDIINVHSGVKEHIIWFYFHTLPWSEEVLKQLIEIYKDERFLALESVVISAIKSDKIENNQIGQLESAFSSKEFKKQIERWKKRNGLA